MPKYGILELFVSLIILGRVLAAPGARRYPFPFKHDGLDDGPWRMAPNPENFRDIDEAGSGGALPTVVVPVIIPDRKLQDKLSCCNPRRPPPPCFVESSFAACLGSGFFADEDNEGFLEMEDPKSRPDDSDENLAAKNFS